MCHLPQALEPHRSGHDTCQNLLADLTCDTPVTLLEGLTSAEAAELPKDLRQLEAALRSVGSKLRTE
jgi:hypothetical protein